jgi:hypothetical protein
MGIYDCICKKCYYPFPSFDPNESYCDECYKVIGKYYINSLKQKCSSLIDICYNFIIKNPFKYNYNILPNDVKKLLEQRYNGINKFITKRDN